MKSKQNKQALENKVEINKIAKEKTEIRKIPLDTIVAIQSNVVGSLYYKSINGDLIFSLNDFGDIEFVTLGNLVTMRNSQPTFFDDNWIVVVNAGENEEYTPEQIYSYLRVEDNYKNVFTPDKIDTLFNMPTNQIEKIVSTYSRGLKSTIFSIASKLYENKKLNSTSKIDAIEKATGKKFFSDDN